MRLPRPRFTVLQLMLAVTIGAMLLGVWRKARFQALADWHHSQIVCVFFGSQGPDGEFIYEATSSPPEERRSTRVSTTAAY